ncbi:arginyl-tRNA synthetase, putative [Babesia bigemina]|uniref:arginine--tRNA ligase n=1 Tax=Babesia bigemina TaxID=5866 RepID=A0A061DB11_BABBI|nr:arginyl-tRNA synthetase, putative [Babesia bigemina]CDR97733.1 arginyl-tRNA synthetase, putative [Babesia bigemina]|eukprot:XP_012769919.1 arginyl-tRNA synthetase, putative [Babesia bigemina]
MGCRNKTAVRRLLILVLSALPFVVAFKYNADLKRGFTTLETIVKRGAERLCDARADDILRQCKRPLVRLTVDAWEGDLHTKVTHAIAEQTQLPVDEVAQRLRDEIRKEDDSVGNCIVTGNGYINIFLKDEFLRRLLNSMQCSAPRRLNVPCMSRDAVVVDYFGPNVGKELHIGHLRSAAIGGAVANILEFCGAKVLRRNHVGDFGSHSGQIMRYLLEYDPTSLDAFSPSQVDAERLREITRQQIGYSLWQYKKMSTTERLAQPTPAVSAGLIANTVGEIYQRARTKCEEDASFMARCKEETALLQRGKDTHQAVWHNIAKTSMRSHRDVLKLFNLEKVRDIPESLYAKRVFALVERLIGAGHARRRADGSVTIVARCASTSNEDAVGGGAAGQGGTDDDDAVTVNIPGISNTARGYASESHNVNEASRTAASDGDCTPMYDSEGVDTPNTASSSAEGRDAAGADDSLAREENELVLITKEGYATYLAVDLTALEHRLRENKADRVIYVTDNAQKTHFEHLAVIAKSVGILTTQRVEHVGFGAVQNADGKKMRSRTGSGPSVLDIWQDTVDRCTREVQRKGEYLGPAGEHMARKLASGSILYADLSAAQEARYTFSADRLLKQGGNNLISILYSFVRCRSILRKLAEMGVRTGEDAEVIAEGVPFANEASRKLALQLVGLENAIYAAASMREPHRLCKYVWALSRKFSHFYQHNRVLGHGGSGVNMEAVQLVDLFAKATQLVLALLNIQTLERL